MSDTPITDDMAEADVVFEAMSCHPMILERLEAWRVSHAALEKRLLTAEGYHLAAQSREAEEARFYRYLRDEAGQLPDDHDGPMICSGLGDNFEFLRGEECDIALREAIEKAHG